MNFIQRYLNRQLTRVLDGVADPATRHTVKIISKSVHHDNTFGELVALEAALLPAQQLASHLMAERVTKSRSVVLDAALG